MDRDRLPTVGDAAVRGRRDRAGDVRYHGRRGSRTGRVAVAEQLPREHPLQHAADRVVRADGVEVEDVTLPEHDQGAAALRGALTAGAARLAAEGARGAPGREDGDSRNSRTQTKSHWPSRPLAALLFDVGRSNMSHTRSESRSTWRCAERAPDL